jgi:hypothetical protein
MTIMTGNGIMAGPATPPPQAQIQPSRQVTGPVRDKQVTGPVRG